MDGEDSPAVGAHGGDAPPFASYPVLDEHPGPTRIRCTTPCVSLAAVDGGDEREPESMHRRLGHSGGCLKSATGIGTADHVSQHLPEDERYAIFPELVERVGDISACDGWRIPVLALRGIGKPRPLGDPDGMASSADRMQMLSSAQQVAQLVGVGN